MTDRNWKPLYINWAITLLLGMAAYYLYQENIYTIIYNSDATHITQVIGVITLIGILRVDWISYLWGDVQVEHFLNSNYIPTIRKHFYDWLWVSDMMMFFGLIGTLIGFYMNFRVISDAITASPSGLNQQIILGLIPNLIVPIGTVFLPTICALSSLVILKIKLRAFESFSGMNDEQYE